MCWLISFLLWLFFCVLRVCPTCSTGMLQCGVLESLSTTVLQIFFHMRQIFRFQQRVKTDVCDLHPDQRMQDSISCQAVFPKRNLSSCMHCIDPLFSHAHDPVNTSNYHGNVRSQHLQPASHTGTKLYAPQEHHSSQQNPGCQPLTWNDYVFMSYIIQAMMETLYIFVFFPVW